MRTDSGVEEGDRRPERRRCSLGARALLSTRWGVQAARTPRCWLDVVTRGSPTTIQPAGEMVVYLKERFVLLGGKGLGCISPDCWTPYPFLRGALVLTGVRGGGICRRDEGLIRALGNLRRKKGKCALIPTFERNESQLMTKLSAATYVDQHGDYGVEIFHSQWAPDIFVRDRLDVAHPRWN